jgi:hypothetical protein
MRRWRRHGTLTDREPLPHGWCRGDPRCRQRALRACLFGQTGPQALRAGQAEELEVLLDQADDCRTPADIRTMAAVVEGTVETASRQEWGIRYTLLP